MSFESSGPPPIEVILPVLLLAGGWISWLAWRRPDQRLLSLRVALSWIALLALAMLASPPSCKVAQPPAEAILLTPGVTLEALEMVQSRLPSSSAVFRLAEDLELALPYGGVSTDLPDTAFLARSYPHVTRVHVLGHGLRSDQLKDLAERTIVSHLSPRKLGVSWLDAPEQLSRGREFQVRGRLAGLPTGEFSLKLTDPGGNMASVPITVADAASGEAGFSLSLTAAVEGPQLYRLELQDRAATLLAEPVPLFVAPPPQLQILILQSSPGFEFRHLENWLAEQGHAVASRSRVSRGRYRRKFTHREPLDLNRLSSATWDQFQLVLADFGSLLALDAGERKALHDAVSEAGLGLLVLADRTLPELRRAPAALRDAFFDFQIERFGDLEMVELDPVISGADAASKLPGRPWELSADHALPLIRDRQGRVLAACVPRGRGRVGVSLLNETYAWRLEGSGKAYASLWTALLDSLVIDSIPRFDLPRQPRAFLHLPLELQLTSAEIPASVEITAPSGLSSRLAWLQDPLDSRRWRSTFWPRETGWHTLVLDGTPATELFVHEDAAWPTLRAAQRTLATLQASRLQEPPEPAAVNTTRPLPKWTLLLFFLAAVGTLWWTGKDPNAAGSVSDQSRLP